MKFAHKLALSVIVLLAAALSVAGYLTVSQNFNVALERAVSQSLTQHLLERYSLEAQLFSLRAYYEQDNADLAQQSQTLANYLGGDGHWQALYDKKGLAVYENLPSGVEKSTIQDKLGAGEQGWYIQQTPDGRSLILFFSNVDNLNSPYTFTSVYDLTPVFAERQRQLRSTLQMDGVILVVSIVLVLGISAGLTRPIRKLGFASRKIARGQYSARADGGGDDEIGELSRNFNLMADAVEGRIDELNLGVRQREDFVSAFTHEIKTPMTAIIGYSDILRFQDVEPDVRQWAAGYIYREAQRLETLSQKLLSLMGLSDREIAPRPVALNDLFRGAARSVFPELREHGLEIKAQPAPGLYVLADADLVVDLLRNLLLNAVRAAPSDGTVWLQWRAENGRCRVMVVDKGRGIPQDELARIVEPFYMVDKSRARREGNSGVGLALCQRIAQLHGTALTFESAVGEGTTVSVALAVAAPAQDADTLATGAETEADAASTPA